MLLKLLAKSEYLHWKQNKIICSAWEVEDFDRPFEVSGENRLAHSIWSDKLECRRFFYLILKGTPSQEEHKKILCCFIMTRMTLSGQSYLNRFWLRLAINAPTGSLPTNSPYDENHTNSIRWLDAITPTKYGTQRNHINSPNSFFLFDLEDFLKLKAISNGKRQVRLFFVTRSWCALAKSPNGVKKSAKSDWPVKVILEVIKRLRFFTHFVMLSF